jgi:hypothetical protein
MAGKEQWLKEGELPPPEGGGFLFISTSFKP